MNPPHSPYASTDDCDLEGYERYKDKSLTELLVRDNADTTMAKAAAVRWSSSRRGPKRRPRSCSP